MDPGIESLADDPTDSLEGGGLERPHDHVFARLGVTRGRGIGVFAIRDIPSGIDPFQGEGSRAVKVPQAEVEAIADGELRRLYIDFCPLVDGCFLAPPNFNALTIAWYVNHSDAPNLACRDAATFVTMRPVARGEELTVDYTTFSAHAESYVRAWRRTDLP